ncbi:MAG: diphthine--ammonia ligase [Candidatus Binatia bacterium]
MKAPRSKERVLFSWSGGKDSAMALHEVRSRGEVEVAALVTTVTEGFDRVSMHGVRRELLARQAQALGVPLEEVVIPRGATNEQYESRLEAALLRYREQGVSRVAYGDLFLEDIRAYREAHLARIGMRGLFPIWKRDTTEMARSFVALGFRALVVCLDPRALHDSFAGRWIDADFFASLPEGVDPCGENGEFHSFVVDGPGFREPVRVRAGEVVRRDAFVFCDLLPEEP